MKQPEIDQIKTLISNLEEAKKKIPYLADLKSHPIFGSAFSDLTPKQTKEIQNLIDGYISEKLQNIKKTKWGQLFSRFAESNPELFRDFRELNNPENTDAKNFQALGKKVEFEMFKLEGALTERMLKQERWLDKVVDAFYTIVYAFFPRFNEIE